MILEECGLTVNSKRKEIRQHGSARFPCAGYESIRTTSIDAIIPWHWHEEFEILYVPEGRMVLKVLSDTYTMTAGQMALVNSSTLHFAQASPSCHLRSVVFSDRLVTGGDESIFAEDFITPLKECTSLSYMIFEAGDPLISQFECAFEALKAASFAYPFMMRQSTTSVLLAAYKKYEKQLLEPQGAKSLDAIRISIMLKYIEEHYAEDLTLDDISSAAHISEREALRCFSRTVGESPTQYLIKYRLMMSTTYLLEEPDEPISNIAGLCGFESPSYYTKKFRELYECTPREYARTRSPRYKALVG